MNFLIAFSTFWIIFIMAICQDAFAQYPPRQQYPNWAVGRTNYGYPDPRIPVANWPGKTRPQALGTKTAVKVPWQSPKTVQVPQPQQQQQTEFYAQTVGVPVDSVYPLRVRRGPSRSTSGQYQPSAYARGQRIGSNI